MCLVPIKLSPHEKSGASSSLHGSFIVISEKVNSWSHPRQASNFPSYHAKSFRHICSLYIAKNVARCIVSRLDYCNSLLIVTWKEKLHMLQLAKNGAHVVSRSKRCEHIQPVLCKLDWLPVTHRINFKVATQTFKIGKTESAYLANLILH